MLSGFPHVSGHNRERPNCFSGTSLTNSSAPNDERAGKSTTSRQDEICPRLVIGHNLLSEDLPAQQVSEGRHADALAMVTVVVVGTCFAIGRPVGQDVVDHAQQDVRHRHDNLP